MFTADRVSIPKSTTVKLRQSADFVDDIMEFAREDLIGFKRPLAAAFAYTTPFFFIFAYTLGGPIGLLQLSAMYFAITIAGLYLVGKINWPTIVSEFDRKTAEKRRAAADLRCGFAERNFLTLARAPRFFEYEGGVIVFADAGDFKTLFLAIEDSPSDLRWALYVSGELERRVWRWLSLPISREIVKFQASASKLANVRAPRRINSIDAFEAISEALGAPQDGAIVHRPFVEVVEIVEQAL